MEWCRWTPDFLLDLYEVNSKYSTFVNILKQFSNNEKIVKSKKNYNLTIGN